MSHLPEFNDEDDESPDDFFPDEDSGSPPGDNYLFLGKRKIDEGGLYLLGVWIDENGAERLGEDYVSGIEDDPNVLYVKATESLSSLFIDTEDAETIAFFTGWNYANQFYYVRKRAYPYSSDALEDARSFFNSPEYGGITFHLGAWYLWDRNSNNGARKKRRKR